MMNLREVKRTCAQTEKAADSLLEKLGITQAPIDPFSVAKEIGLRINQWVTLQNIQKSGSIKRNKDKISVWLNPLDPKRRQNFTLAHEIGHFINNIEMSNFEFVDTPKEIYKSEENQDLEANKFAFELLMPKNEVFRIGEEILEKKETKEIPIDQFLELMANRFEVSKQVMFIRLKSLKII